MASTPESDVRSSTPRLANGEGHDDATIKSLAGEQLSWLVDQADLLRKLLRVKVQPTKFGGRSVIVDAASHAVFERFGLLKDFLQHVMVVVTQVQIVGYLIKQMD